MSASARQAFVGLVVFAVVLPATAAADQGRDITGESNAVVGQGDDLHADSVGIFGNRIATQGRAHTVSGSSRSALPEVRFDTAKWMIKRPGDGRTKLLQQARKLPAGSWVKIAGYADVRGKPGDNLILSRKRACTVERLLRRVGLRTISVAYGEGRPSGGGYESDRRVVSTVIPPPNRTQDATSACR